MKILFSGGGTAGHILPIIAIVREMKKLNLDLEFFYIGPEDEFSSILLSQEGIKIKKIFAGKIRRYWGLKSFFQNMVDILFKIPFGFFQSFFYIFILSPDLIFSKGGYGSLAPVFAAWILQVPIFLHESDVTPGLANRLMSRFALEIFVSFPIFQTEYFPPKKMISVGNPIKKEILEGSPQEAKKMFNLSGERPVILILGGSQGAQRINDLVLAILPEILEKYEIIHQCGEKKYKEVLAEAAVVIPKSLEKYYHLFSFLMEIELKQAYQAADLVISRAGSGSIFEIAACGKAAILIPLPESAQEHQIKNAYTYAELGGALVIEESNLTSHFFLERIDYLLTRPALLKKMEKAAKDFSRPRSAEIIAQYLGDYLTQ